MGKKANFRAKSNSTKYTRNYRRQITESLAPGGATLAVRHHPVRGRDKQMFLSCTTQTAMWFLFVIHVW